MNDCNKLTSLSHKNKQQNVLYDDIHVNSSLISVVFTFTFSIISETTAQLHRNKLHPYNQI